MYNSIYPGYINSYLGIKNRQITRKQDDEKNPQSSNAAENDLNERKKNSNPAEQNTISNTNNYFPNGERVAIDYTRRQINITQVLSDFRNTANAIGAPDDVKAEVNAYLTLVEGQSQKRTPNSQIIQANLKNASQILDEYITNTLKKPSKVVENWVDALFLQKIDYKAPQEEPPVEDAEILTGQNEEIPHEGQQIEESPEYTAVQKKEIYVPQDSRLKSMFIQAKKYAAIDEKEKALYEFGKVLEYADEIGDIRTAAMSHYEQGRLYDEFNKIEDALYSYDMAAKYSDDDNIKARAHISMGKIYDDYVKFEPAVNHYIAAVSFAGESDNINLQTKALSDLTLIHSNRYDKDNAYMFMDLTDIMAEETGNNRLKSIVYSKNARCCEKLNNKPQALKYYGKSSFAGSEDGDGEKLAKNYKSAADIMLGYGNKAKARKLLTKAYRLLLKCDNPELMQEVVNQITSI